MIQLIRSETIKKNQEPIQKIGWLYVHNKEGDVVGSFATLELPWKNNAPMVSCIPPGPKGDKMYDVELLDESPAFNYKHYWIKYVPGRKGIKIHRGNYYDQIEGCILIGKDHTDINKDGVVDVVDSHYALNQLIALVGKKGKLMVKSF